jgi:hypothetical protein
MFIILASEPEQMFDLNFDFFFARVIDENVVLRTNQFSCGLFFVIKNLKKAPAVLGKGLV